MGGGDRTSAAWVGVSGGPPILAETAGEEAGPIPVGSAPGPIPGAPGPATIDAFPRVEVPEEVAPASTFDVVVGLGSQAQGGVVGGPIRIARDTVELTVQIKAENFFVAQVRHTLVVDTANLEANVVRIPVVAPTPPHAWRGRIEIEYSANGLLVGSAWRDLVVTAGASPAAPPSTAGGDTRMEMSQQLPIDLTVSISRGEASGKFLWSFTTPHPVALPEVQVETLLDRESAETFALRKIRDIAKVDGSPTAELKILGVAREVAEALPLWFWKLLTPIWQLAKAEGRVPTLLIVSREALVPWELASTESDFVVDQSLLDAGAPPILSAQVVIGRWCPAGPETPSGVRRPSTAPAERINVRRLAVVVGEFGPASGFRSLKEAISEGQELTGAYPSVWVKGTTSDVAMLLKGDLTDRGQPVTAEVLHVASHGEVDPDSPINSGVILSDSAVRIDEQIVIGSDFTRRDAPFVFLNACQLATDSGSSLVEGGLAAAFLRAGARGFVAPLWSIDDTIAKQTALLFYAAALTSGEPVGEVMRRLRARFHTDFPQHDQTTPLAYAYYGHPGLRLTKEN
ncbi:MAG: CHAT domain-containing protein [Micropruina sp.]|nr:CHAT domain-containing protein [Micropruina sp.]